MGSFSSCEDEILVALRRITRANDLRSRRLLQDYGLTVPQLLTLRAIDRLQPVRAGDLADEVDLAQPTVTGITARLEQHGLVRSTRALHDRRSLDIRLSDEGKRVLRDAPSLLQDHFVRRLCELESMEQGQVLDVLQQVADMMDAGEIDAPRLLGSEFVDATSTTALRDREDTEDAMSSERCSRATDARSGPLAGWVRARRSY